MQAVVFGHRDGSKSKHVTRKHITPEHVTPKHTTYKSLLMRSHHGSNSQGRTLASMGSSDAGVQLAEETASQDIVHDRALGRICAEQRRQECRLGGSPLEEHIRQHLVPRFSQ